jgi:iron complex outermembrane receptor protein
VLVRRIRTVGASVVGLAALVAAQPVCAATILRLRIPNQPTARALLALAGQAGVSIGGDITGCSGKGGLSGSYSLDTALDLLLHDSSCTYVLIDARTVLIRRRPLPTIHDKPPVPVQLPEVVVTAPRRPTLLTNAPLSISVEDGARLSGARLHDINELATDVVGLTVTNLGPGRDKILLRGLSDGGFTGSTQSSVSLYLDDLPITYNAPDPGLRLTDIDRVEIVRGPQGALYGGGAIGGVVRIIPAAPSTAKFAGSASVDVAVTKSGAPSIAGDLMLNIPVLDGRGAVRLAAYSETDGGYIDNPALGLRDVNKTARVGLRLSGVLDLDARWRLSLSGVTQTINTADGQYVTDPAGGLTKSAMLREPYENDFSDISATLQGAFWWGEVKAAVGLIHHRLDTRFDASLGLQLFDPAATGPGAYDEQRRINLAVADLTVRSRDTGRLRWVAGVFLARGEDDIASVIGPASLGASPLYREDRTDERLETAIFAEGSYRLAPRLDLTIGLRTVVSQLAVKSTVTQPALSAATRKFSDRDVFTGASPKIALAYRLARSTTTYVQFAEGYRAGGFNTGGPIGQVFDVPGLGVVQHNFRPDSAWTLEGGVNANLFARRMTLHAAAYRTHWSSIQTDQFSSFRLPYTTNVGDGDIQGVEIEAAARPSADWTVKAGAIFAEPQLALRRNPNFLSNADAGLPGVPSRSFNLSANFRHPLGERLALTASARFAYVGRSNLTFDDQTRAAMGGYVTGRLQVGVETGALRVVGYVDNPANIHGDTFAFGNPFGFLFQGQSTPLRPRTAGLAISADF